jgi:hypothetical protein
MKTKFSRRGLLQGAGALAGGLAASKLSGGLVSNAYAQTAPEKSALMVVFLLGGYNSLFCSADSYASANTFGVTGTNTKDLGNGLVIDGATYGTMSPYALAHMSTVGVRHGITAHGTAENADFSDGSRSYALQLAAAMGGDAAIKAVQLGARTVPGAKPAEGSVSMQTITDMSSTIAALGGATDPTIPDRAIAANGLLAAKNMSVREVTTSPRMLTSLTEGYAAGIDVLQKPVKPFNFTDLTTAYGVASTTRTVNSFTTQILAGELMIQAGANVTIAIDNGWDTHGDTDGAQVRSMMNQRILPPLKVFMNRMMNRPDYNVGLVIFGDFARSLPGSDHASALSATVVGKYVKVGTTGKMSANVQLPAGTPSVPGLWSYLSEIMKVPTASNPFGVNQHPSLLL